MCSVKTQPDNYCCSWESFHWFREETVLEMKNNLRSLSIPQTHVLIHRRAILFPRLGVREEAVSNERRLIWKDQMQKVQNTAGENKHKNKIWNKLLVISSLQNGKLRRQIEQPPKAVPTDFFYIRFTSLNLGINFKWFRKCKKRKIPQQAAFILGLLCDYTRSALLWNPWALVTKRKWC